MLLRLISVQSNASQIHHTQTISALMCAHKNWQVWRLTRNHTRQMKLLLNTQRKAVLPFTHIKTMIALLSILQLVKIWKLTLWISMSTMCKNYSYISMFSYWQIAKLTFLKMKMNATKGVGLSFISEILYSGNICFLAFKRIHLAWVNLLVKGPNRIIYKSVFQDWLGISTYKKIYRWRI